MAYDDVIQTYRLIRDELIDPLSALSAAAATQDVPSCPAWTVKDVAAHLCGLNAELIAGVQGGLGNDQATARQVSDRAAHDLSRVLTEWKSHDQALADVFAAGPDMGAALTGDLIVHVYDLAEVLDQPTTEAARATPMSSHRYVVRLQQRLAEQMEIALTVKLTDGTTWLASEGTKPVTLATSPHNFLRGVTGRLTRAEVESFDWSIDPARILDQAWNQYGPFRSTTD